LILDPFPGIVLLIVIAAGQGVREREGKARHGWDENRFLGVGFDPPEVLTCVGENRAHGTCPGCGGERSRPWGREKPGGE